MAYEQEREAALEAAVRAGKLILGAYEEFRAIPDARADITTQTDRDSQEMILGHLHQQFPGDALCAEEETPTLARAPRAGSRLWIVDPIDGTRGFAKKNGEFSVMIAFWEGGEVKVGVVLEPAPTLPSGGTGMRLTYAVRGEGCWCSTGGADALTSPGPCRVSATTEVSEAALTQTHSRDPQTPSRPAQLLQPGRIVESYSAGVKLALVARGEVDLYVNFYPNFHDWDIAAGHLLVEEAGGQVTGMKGGTIEYGTGVATQRQGLLASNGILHSAALERLGDSGS